MKLTATCITAITATWLLTGVVAAQTKRSLGRVTTITLPKDLSVQRVFYQDLSGDGRPDLVIAASREAKRYDRYLRIHYNKGASARTPFAIAPDAIVPVPASVVACAIGDLHGDPGGELIWFGARGVYAFRPKANEKEQVVDLVASEFLFQFPGPSSIASWQSGVRDIDGDGRSDLLVPESGGFQVAVQRRDAAGAVRFVSSRLELPGEAPEKQTAGTMTVRTGGGDVSLREGFDLGLTLGGSSGTRRPPLVSVEEKVPAPQLSDWDGDGNLDVIAKRGEQVLVWIQGDGGRFASKPDRVLAFPLTAQQTQLDPSFDARLADFSGDGRTDVVLFTKDRNSDDIRSQVLFFPQKPAAPAPLFNNGTPQQLLILPGLAVLPRLVDIDGNGQVDLQVGAWRLDLLNQLTAGGEQSIEGDLHVYLNRRGRFSRRPDLTYKVTLSGDELSEGNDLMIRFLGDVTGDGVSELLVREKPKEVKLLWVRRRNQRLSIVTRPMWQIRVDEDASIRVLPDGSKRPGFLVLEDHQVVLVTF